jgi:hypothetical protein
MSVAVPFGSTFAGDADADAGADADADAGADADADAGADADPDAGADADADAGADADADADADPDPDADADAGSRREHETISRSPTASEARMSRGSTRARASTHPIGSRRSWTPTRRGTSRPGLKPPNSPLKITRTTRAHLLLLVRA